jgi:peptidoglycan/LPS O-acetylase OafA/YrhL
MFFGVAWQWPAAGLALRYVPARRRRSVARVGLLLYYVCGLALAAASLDASQRAVLASRSMEILLRISFAVYLVGQLLIWRRLRTL